MKNNKDALGDRMKAYENISRIYLPKKMPVIIRLDGKSFHVFTRGFKKPFDEILIKAMQETAKYLCKNIMGCKLAYTQSDGISLLLVDYEKINTAAWFDNNLQKLSSIAASMATMKFNKVFADLVDEFRKENMRGPDPWKYVEGCNRKYINSLLQSANNGAIFDGRAFVLPKEEVCNYFIWRQEDATRNSVQMVAQANFPHKQLQKKKSNQLQEMLFKEKGINWNNYPTYQKRGSCCIKEKYFKSAENGKDINIDLSTGKTQKGTWRSHWVTDTEIPIFTKDRNYIDNFVFPKKEYTEN